MGHCLTHQGSLLPLVGSSGGIAGILGAFLVLHPRARIKAVLFLPIPFLFKLPVYAYVGIWLFLQTVLIVFVPSPNSENAWIAHVIGLLCGLFLTVSLKKFQAFYSVAGQSPCLSPKPK